MTWQPIGHGLDAANLDGVWWHDAPLPWRWHRCTPQTRATMDGRLFERCACGGCRLDGGHWFERNTRRKR